jgi:hypothetical protein
MDDGEFGARQTHTASAAERYKIFMKITNERGLFFCVIYNNFDH